MTDDSDTDQSVHTSNDEDEAIEGEIMEQLKEGYTKPGSPLGFTDAQTIYKYFNGQLSYEKIYEFLASQDAYTLTRRSRRLKYYNMTYVFRKRQNIQMDVFFMREFKKSNKSIEHILIGIDVFTRYMWACPIYNTSANEGIRGTKNILEQIGDDIENLTVDKGSEFVSRKYRTFIEKRGVKLHYTNSKASIAERAILTLKRYIYRFFAQTDNLEYIDKLSDFVMTYNQHYHRFLKRTPAQAELPRNELKVAHQHALQRSKLMALKQRVRFRVGDKVRVSKIKSRMERGYDQSNTYEAFQVYAVDLNMPIPRFYLKALDSEERIKGAFYANELTKVTSDTYKVIILKKRTRKGKEEYFVKWKGYSGINI